MSKELVIGIAPTGQVAALHMDGFDLGFLGEKKVTRQTEILFNADTQKWDIEYLRDSKGRRNPALDGFDGYETARTFEVEWINACRLHGLEPDTDLGFAYAYHLRFIKKGCFALPDGRCIAPTGTCMHAPSYHD